MFHILKRQSNLKLTKNLDFYNFNIISNLIFFESSLNYYILLKCIYVKSITTI